MCQPVTIGLKHVLFLRGNDWENGQMNNWYKQLNREIKKKNINKHKPIKKAIDRGIAVVFQKDTCSLKHISPQGDRQKKHNLVNYSIVLNGRFKMFQDDHDSHIYLVNQGSQKLPMTKQSWSK